MTGKLYYLATVYSKHPNGIDVAFDDAARLCAKLLKERPSLNFFSPIVYTHPIALAGQFDPLDHSLWLPFDEIFWQKCDGLVVAMMPRWTESFGIAKEIEWFTAHGKPIYYLNPETLELFDERPDV